MSGIILLTDYHRYYLYSGFVDMKKSFDGLCGIVRNELGRTVNDKEIFIFLYKRCTHIKLLLAETDGYSLFYRRLHKGRFNIPAADETGAIQLNAKELLFLLSGLTWQLKKKTVVVHILSMRNSHCRFNCSSFYKIKN